MAFNQELLKGTVSLLVLRLLRENDMYGYQMIKELDTRSANAFELNEGALYPILHKLEAGEYIAAYWESSETARRRKYYHLTPRGGALLEEKASEWQRFSESVSAVLWRERAKILEFGGTQHAKGFI
jgi:PadR family transcriptional regulator PadR